MMLTITATLAGLLCLTVHSLAATPRQTADCLDPSLASTAGLNLYAQSFRINSPSIIPGADYTKVKVATNFEVTYYGTFKVVSNLYQYAKETYVLYQCGTSQPDVSSLNLTNVKMFQVPLKAISVADTTALGFMKLLNVQNRIQYVVENAVDPCMQSLGIQGCNRLSSNVTAGDVDAEWYGFSVYPNNPLAITFTATADPGALNRAEYIKYVATFFNKEAQANQIFTDINSTYYNLKATVASSLLASNSTGPVVAWMYWQAANPSYGSYYGREHFRFYLNAYRRDFIQDAGGRMLNVTALNATYGDGVNVEVLADGSSIFLWNMTTARDTLKLMLKDVDVIIDESIYIGKKPSDITLDTFRQTFGLTADADLTTYKFLLSQRVLRTDASSNAAGDTDWYEMAVARPDLALQDLIVAFNPSALPSNPTPNYVKSLFSPNRVTILAPSQQCLLNNCQQPATPICPSVYRECNGQLVYATATQPCAPACGVPSPPPPKGAAAANMPSAIVMLLAVVLAVISLAL